MKELEIALDEAYAEDTELNDALAEYFLDGGDVDAYYREASSQMLEDVYDMLEQNLAECLKNDFPEMKEINVRKLIKSVYPKLNIEEKK